MILIKKNQFTVHENDVRLSCMVSSIVVIRKLDVPFHFIWIDFKHLLANIQTTVCQSHQMGKWTSCVSVTSLIWRKKLRIIMSCLHVRYKKSEFHPKQHRREIQTFVAHKICKHWWYTLVFKKSLVRKTHNQYLSISSCSLGSIWK